MGGLNKNQNIAQNFKVGKRYDGVKYPLNLNEPEPKKGIILLTKDSSPAE